MTAPNELTSYQEADDTSFISAQQSGSGPWQSSSLLPTSEEVHSLLRQRWRRKTKPVGYPRPSDDGLETGAEAILPATLSETAQPSRAQGSYTSSSDVRPTLTRPIVDHTAFHFSVSDRFEGEVQEVSGDIFSAKIFRRVGDVDQYANVEIPVEDVDLADRRFLRVGARFYWLFGYEMKPYRVRKSILSFAGHRRVSNAEIEARAQDLMTLLDNDDPSP